MTDSATEPAVESPQPITPSAPAPETGTAAPTAGQEGAPQEGTPGEEAPKPDETKPQRTFSQEEYERGLQKRLAQERRRMDREIALRVENEVLRRQTAQPAPARGDAQPAPGNGEERPRPEQFKDWDAYNEALVDWKVGERIRRESQNARRFEATTAVQQYAQAVRSKLATGAEKYEDFEDVVTAPGVVFTDPMVNAMLDVPAPHDVAYFLGTHPEESQRIGMLSPAAQVREIDKIAAQLSKPPAPTKAPEPIKPNLGTGGVEKSLEDAQGNYKEWLKVRNRQLAQRG